ncbi:MAG: SIR2 family protein [Alphaproteobacteria bacterium]|nr:SIR2 family protein [Alphaproteobacteria bacterium]
MQSSVVDFRQKTSRFYRDCTPDLVVVFGAGASKGGGLPITYELMGEMRRWARSNGKERYLRGIDDFIQGYYFSFAHKDAEYPNIEDVLGLLEAANQYSRIRASGVGSKWRGDRISQIRSHLARLIGEFLWSFQDGSVDTRTDAYRRLIRMVGPKVVFVTFNYDLLLETALTLEGVQFSYGLDPNLRWPAVLKPHGSINWYDTRLFKVRDTDPAYQIGDSIAASRMLGDASRPVRFHDREPVIVTPTPTKQFELFELKKLWTSVSAAIHSAPKVCFVGYSLPETDRTARIVFRRAGPPHHAARRIHVVDPSDLQDRLRDRISPDLHYHRMKFETWVTDLEDGRLRI